MSLLLSLLLIGLCTLAGTVEILTRRSQKLFCVVLVALFVYIIAGRNIYIVPDSPAYVETYQRVEADTYILFTDWVSMGFTFEPGYMFLNLAAKKIGLEIGEFLGLLALIPCLVYLYAMNKTRTYDKTGQNNGKLLCVYFSLWVFFWGFIYSGITVRIGMAIPIAFLAHIFLREKKFLQAGISFCIAYTFHYSILVYPLFLYLSSFINIKHKSYYIYGAVIILLWLINISNEATLSLHDVTSEILSMFAGLISSLARYAGYIDNIYNSFTSRKNFLFIIMLFVFIRARPKDDPNYDHWLKFFTLNLALTFPLSSFIIGYRVSDICLISALPLLSHCTTCHKFSLGLRITIYVMFMVSMMIFALRMTGIY